MYSAVLLAGYDNRKRVERYKKIVNRDYDEEFMETGYKPLREFSLVQNGKRVSRPLMRFTLEELVADSLVREIVIVGFVAQIRDRLGEYLDMVKKPIRFVDQNAALDAELIKRFKIQPKKTAHDSIGGNFIKGYCATQAFLENRHALFVASDSPFTSKGFINRFIEKADPLLKDNAVLMPAIYMDPERDDLGRRPMLLHNDTGQAIHVRTDNYGRHGFRLSSLLLCNPHLMNVNSINVVYSARKALSPGVQIRIQKICKRLGYPGILKSYFVRHSLSFGQGEKIMSAFLEGGFRGIPMPDLETTYDFDGTRREYGEIERMLAERGMKH